MAANEFVDGGGFTWADQPGFEWERPASEVDPLATTVVLASLVTMAKGMVSSITAAVRRRSLAEPLGDFASPVGLTIRKASTAMQSVGLASTAATIINLRARVILP